MLRSMLVAAALACSLAGGAAAQDSAAATAAAPAAVTDTAGPVAVPPATETALRYHRSGNVLWVLGTIWGVLVPAALLFGGWSARIRSRASRVAGGRWFPTLAVYVLVLSVVLWLVDLPLAYYTGFVREHQYALSNQSFGKWLRDSVLALALGIVGTALVLWIPYLLIRRSPRRWWLWTGMAAVPLVVFSLWFQPVFIDPLFNDFGAMRDKPLEARILALAERAGIEGSRVFEVKKSEDTNAVNAYVTGFGGSKRIVLWDTLLGRLDDREVLFVMGHEMGHYVLRHVLYSIVLVSGLLLLSLYAVHRSAGWLIGRYGRRFGFDSLADVASYPLLVLVVSLVGLVVTPPVLAFQRHLEHEGDRFGLELTRDNRAAATAFVKLQTQNLGVPYPSPLYTFFRESHPSLGRRIEFANEYRPWETGAPLKYGEKFEK